MESKIAIVSFIDDPISTQQIAALHLSVRFQQRSDGENRFKTDIFDSQADLSNIEGYYKEPGGNFFIATEEETLAVAGFIGIKRLSKTTGEIKRLAVLPQFRRRGLGRRLAETAVQWSAEAGIQKLQLTTGQQENARSIYEDVGFVWVKDIPEHEDIAMELKLDRRIYN